MVIKKAIQAGNICRDKWNQNRSMPLYMGSGQCGACFDEYGLMNRPYQEHGPGNSWNTCLTHAAHWRRGEFGKDCFVPVYQWKWKTAVEQQPDRYSQELELYRGRLQTVFCCGAFSYTLSACFNPASRDLLAVWLDYEGQLPEMELVPVANDKAVCSADSMVLSTGQADTVVLVKSISETGDIHISAGERSILLSFTGKKGRHLLLFGVCPAERRGELEKEMEQVGSLSSYEKEVRDAWAQRWGNSFLWVPQPHIQALWARSLFYVLSSFSPGHSPAPPCGWSGHAWNFHFPQDVSFIHPVLLRLGHLDLAKGIVEYYNQFLDDMQAVTKRIYGKEGTMWAWEFPIGANREMLKDGTPNWYQYEIHNAAYPARMAYETACYAQDGSWSRAIAWPIVYHSARFFADVLEQEKCGTWGIAVTPSMGQDENGERNGKNYLCALYAARYCLTTALKMAEEWGIRLEEKEQWKRMVADGFSFSALYHRQYGLYKTSETMKDKDWGKQKHPVQFNPMVFLPCSPINEAERQAYERRRELCTSTRAHQYAGWTLGAFWLAASHLGDKVGFTFELEQMKPGHYTDEEQICILESSGFTYMPYYVTTHGLYLQAVCDAFVHDFFGEAKLCGACPESWQGAVYENLYTMDGQPHSGQFA